MASNKTPPRWRMRSHAGHRRSSVSGESDEEKSRSTRAPVGWISQLRYSSRSTVSRIISLRTRASIPAFYR